MPRKRKTPQKTPEAEKVLESLIEAGFRPERLDQLNDTFELMGVVMGRLALLRVVADPDADTKAAVSAARALISTREDPEHIAERLRASSLSDLSVPDLKAIIRQMENASLQEIDMQELIHRLKKEKSHGDQTS